MKHKEDHAAFRSRHQLLPENDFSPMTGLKQEQTFSGFLKALSADLQQIIAAETDKCLECGGDLHLHPTDGELFCLQCGLVWGSEAENNRIPFSEGEAGGHYEDHWSPTIQLAPGRGLGVNQFVSQKAFMYIISRKNGNNEDLGLRARHLRLLTCKVEHPWMLRMLSLGMQFSQKFGFDKKDERCIRFANALGRSLRRVASLYIVRGEHEGELTRIARAIFCVVVGEFFGEEKTAEAKQQLKVNQVQCDYAAYLLDALSLKQRNKMHKGNP